MQPTLAPATRALLIATVAVTALQWLVMPGLIVEFALWPLGGPAVLAAGGGETVSVGFRPWQLVTYAFLHGNFAHLFLNGFALYMFGSEIERTLGTRPYFFYYFACVIGAAVTQLLVTGPLSSADGFVPTVGASGGIFGLLLAYGMFYPRRTLMLVFPPIPMPAWLFVTLYAITELVFGLMRTQSPIAHFAHLGGMVAGLVLILYWRGKLPIKPKRRLMI